MAKRRRDDVTVHVERRPGGVAGVVRDAKNVVVHETEVYDSHRDAEHDAKSWVIRQGSKLKVSEPKRLPDDPNQPGTVRLWFPDAQSWNAYMEHHDIRKFHYPSVDSVLESYLSMTREEAASGMIVDVERGHAQRTVPNESDDLVEQALELPIANTGDYDEDKTLFRMWFGAYGETKLFVWADSLESAFEEAVEWLDDNAPGQLTSLDESDLRAAAKDLGIRWDEAWSDGGARGKREFGETWNPMDDAKFQRVVEHAEVDLTVVGHTTLQHGSYVISHEWGGDEVTDEEVIEIVATRSEDDDGDGEGGDEE